MKSILIALLLSVSAYGMDPITNLVPVDTGTSPSIHQQYWTDSPAADYHKSAVRIQAGPYAGSGAIIELEVGSSTFAITNRHVVEAVLGGDGKCVIYYQDGRTQSVQVVYASEENDLAILHSPQPPLADGLPVSMTSNPVGSSVEMLGFGGPSTGFRHVQGRTIPSQWFDHHRGTTHLPDPER